MMCISKRLFSILFVCILIGEHNFSILLQTHSNHFYLSPHRILNYQEDQGKTEHTKQQDSLADIIDPKKKEKGRLLDIEFIIQRNLNKQYCLQ